MSEILIRHRPERRLVRGPYCQHDPNRLCRTCVPGLEPSRRVPARSWIEPPEPGVPFGRIDLPQPPRTVYVALPIIQRHLADQCRRAWSSRPSRRLVLLPGGPQQ